MILAKVWLDRESLREQLKDCSAAFDRQQEMLDKNAEQIATLREKIGRLLDTVTDLRVKLEAAKQEAEIQKAKADKHYELGTEYFDLYTKALRGQLKEME